MRHLGRIVVFVAALLIGGAQALAQSIGGNASLSVSGSTSNVAFPVLPVGQFSSAIIAPAFGTTVEIFYKLGNGSVTAATTSASLPSGGICVNIGPNTNVAAITGGSSANLRITQITSCGTTFAGGGGLSVVDEAPFTYGTSPFTPGGGFYNSSITALASGQQGAFALTANRSLHTLDDNSAALLSAATSAIPAGSNNIGSVNQGSAPWTVNPGTAANWGVGATGSAVPANAFYDGGLASSSEPTATTTGDTVGALRDLAGKAVTSPYANRENMVRGAASATGTGATTVIASAGGSLKNYITDVECGRTDAGSTAAYVTFNDSASTILVLPNGGGGGGNNKTFNVPIVTAAATAFTFTSSASITTVYCNAQGFKGY